MKVLAFLTLALAIVLTAFGIGEAAAGGYDPKYDPKVDPKDLPSGGQAANIGIKNNLDLSVKSISGAEAYSKAFGGQGGTGGNGTGYGGQGGAANNGGQSMTSNYSSSVPRQTPFAYAPTAGMNSSFISCKNSVSMGASVPGGAGSLAFPVDDDACDTRLDADHFVQYGLPRAACYRFTQQDSNSDALKASGVSCDQVEKMAVAVPAAAPVVQTPALDDYVSRKELGEKLDNIHRIESQK